MTSTIGLESLIQRGKSAFFTKLVSVYQESHDALLDRPKATDSDIWLTLKDLKTADKLTAVFVSEFGPVFMDTNIESDSSVNMYCSILTTKELSKRLKKQDATPGMIIEEINRVYDDRVAKIDPTSDFTQAFKFRVGLTTALWSLRDADGSFYLTAEELAAITLHEIGHADQFIRHAARLYGLTVDASDIITYVQSSGDRQTALLLIDKLKKSKSLDKSWRKILEVTEKYFQTNNSVDDATYREALDSLCLAAIRDVSVKSLLLVDYNMMGLVRNRVDTRLHSRLDMERSADDYAARNGAYTYLVTALRKMHDTDDVRSDLYYRRYMPAFLATTVKILQCSAVLLIPLQDINMGYDSLVRRMRMILETAKHAFHDDKLPPAAKADINAQIKEVENYIKDYEKTGYYQTRLLIKNWTEKVSKFGRILKAPFENRLTSDYEVLQDANRSLSRHGLYYLANKR